MRGNNMDKKIGAFIFVWISCACSLSAKFVQAEEKTPDCAITYLPPSVEGGRFGDHIVAYCKTKYFSLKHHLPLLYKPFQLSNALKLHRQETIFNQMHYMHFKRQLNVNSEADIINNLQPGTLFVVSMYTRLTTSTHVDTVAPSPAVAKQTFFWIDEIYQKMLEDPIFYSVIQDQLQPVVTLPKSSIPSGYISVALHVRRGGGFDGPIGSAQYVDQMSFTPQICMVTVDKKFPLKFPPEQFFVDQVRVLSELFHDVPMFVQLFTDDLQAFELLDRLKRHCNKNNIVWAYCPTIWKESTLEEIFAMTHFDCLIRSCSHFGGIAQLLGNHKIVIWPTDYEWQSNYLNISRTSVMINSNNKRSIYTLCDLLDEAKKNAMIINNSLSQLLQTPV